MYKLSDFSNAKKQNDTQKLDFIEALTKKWSDIHDQSGVFRYKIINIQEKVVDGNYLLQLNPDRSINRRTPEQIKNIIQPFDENKFNFTKASSNEIIFKIVDDDQTHVILVNVSPISLHHSLLCPSLEKCLPQIITEDSLVLVLKIMFLAGDRNLRIGINSLCALASVNHLHYHLFLEKHDLPIETATCRHLHKQIYYLTDYPIQAFCFEVAEENLLTIAKECYNLVAYLLRNSIAHNLFITRGSSPSGSTEEVVRIIVWARRSGAGAKQLAAFNVAVCEMSGWFPVYSEKDFDNLTRDNLEVELKSWCINDFVGLCNQIKQVI